MGAENIRDLQCGTHEGRELHGRQNIQWTGDLSQYVGGHLSIERRCLNSMSRRT